MYLGTSPYFDFAVCFGLGIAIAACLISTVHGVREIYATFSSPLVQAALRIILLCAFGGAQLAIAAAIGETKPMRDANSVLGVALGIGVTLPLVLKTFHRAPSI